MKEIKVTPWERTYQGIALVHHSPHAMLPLLRCGRGGLCPYVVELQVYVRKGILELHVASRVGSIIWHVGKHRFSAKVP